MVVERVVPGEDPSREVASLSPGVDIGPPAVALGDEYGVACTLGPTGSAEAHYLGLDPDAAVTTDLSTVAPGSVAVASDVDIAWSGSTVAIGWTGHASGDPEARIMLSWRSSGGSWETEGLALTPVESRGPVLEGDSEGFGVAWVDEIDEDGVVGQQIRFGSVRGCF
jgi:hypothetical protein